MNQIMQVLGIQIGGNTVLVYIITLSVLIFSVALIKLFSRRLHNAIIKKLPTAFSTIAEPLRIQFARLAYLAATYFPLQLMSVSSTISLALEVLASILFVFFFMKIILAILEWIIRIRLQTKKIDFDRKTGLQGLWKIIQLLLWALAGFVLLDNFGIKITPLLAGFGIGGAAIGLAAQNLLKDMLSYFSIYFDEPFAMGDFIVLGDLMGTVENIGVKTSRIRSLSGEQVIISNTDLTSSRIRNFKRMQQRWTSFSFKISYNTPLEKLKEIPKTIKETIENFGSIARFDRAHLAAFESAGIRFDVAYVVMSSDFNQHMDIQQNILLAIKSYLDKGGITFAQPLAAHHL